MPIANLYGSLGCVCCVIDTNSNDCALEPDAANRKKQTRFEFAS
jgi:hypothetical protein